MAVDPVPVVLIVSVVHADTDVHLGSSPKTGPVRAREPEIRVKNRQLKLPVRAVKHNAGAFVAVRFIVCSQYETDPLFGSHAVFGAILRPPATSTYTVVAAILVVLISGALGDRNHGVQNQQDQ